MSRWRATRTGGRDDDGAGKVSAEQGTLQATIGSRSAAVQMSKQIKGTAVSAHPPPLPCDEERHALGEHSLPAWCVWG